ncbi:hypothetical protein ONA92_02180 [Mycobacteroides salmoniphilum]|uniref:hypothetical protein n=1 Tax=Mycobacteroides salmoniphilum TaxID=404941 RepID=UPI00356149FE
MTEQGVKDMSTEKCPHVALDPTAACDLLQCRECGELLPDLSDDVDELDADDEFVMCRCFGELTPADKARRLGCDQRGGCSELRDSMEF